MQRKTSIVHTISKGPVLYLEFNLNSNLLGGTGMLLFSQYLRELLEIKQMSISALSRLSGVERTALSKTLAGQRVLSLCRSGQVSFTTCA